MPRCDSAGPATKRASTTMRNMVLICPPRTGSAGYNVASSALSRLQSRVEHARLMQWCHTMRLYRASGRAGSVTTTVSRSVERQMAGDQGWPTLAGWHHLAPHGCARPLTGGPRTLICNDGPMHRPPAAVDCRSRSDVPSSATVCCHRVRSTIGVLPGIEPCPYRKSNPDGAKL